MKMQCKLFLFISCIALSVYADRAHEILDANKETILAQPVTVCGEIAFSVGRAVSSRSLGDAVGYTKAEENAKWNFGEKYRRIAPWPADIKEDEKQPAWLEYRVQHPERFSVFGMQRIFSHKDAPDKYTIVLSFPADQMNIPAPTQEELESALKNVRQRRIKKIQQEPEDEKVRSMKPAKANENFDEGLML